MKFFNTSLHEEIFIQFRYQEAATKRCFYLGHLEISASASSLEFPLALAMQKIYFCLRNFFWKNRIFMGFFWCLVMVSVPLYYKYLFLYDFLFIHFKRVHWCSRKKLFELFEASVHWYFENITAPKISAYFPAKYQRWTPF